MSDADDVESLRAQVEILLERLVKAQDEDPRENPWVKKMAAIEKKNNAKLKKREADKPVETMWVVIGTFILVLIVAGLVNRYVEWAFGIGIGH